MGTLNFRRSFSMIKNKVTKYPMNNQFTAVVKKDGEWWIGWIEEIPGVNCQEKSKKSCWQV